MEERIEVQLTEQTLFDFLLFHTYSKATGFLINVLGLAVAFMGIITYLTGKGSTLNLVLYLLAAVAFLAYTPLGLKRRAKLQMKSNDEFRLPAQYSFGENGIDVRRGERERAYPWEQVERVVTTPKTIGFYIGKDEALIVPKESFGTQFVAIMQIAVANISRTRAAVRTEPSES